MTQLTGRLGELVRPLTVGGRQSRLGTSVDGGGGGGEGRLHHSRRGAGRIVKPLTWRFWPSMTDLDSGCSPREAMIADQLRR